MATAKDRCVRCQKKFKLTIDNTVVYMFVKPGFERFSWFSSVCSYCETLNGTFMDGHLNELQDIVRITGCEVVVNDYPDTKHMLDWCTVNGITPVQERQLTSHEEHEVEFFAWLLGCDPKYIWAEFE